MSRDYKNSGVSKGKSAKGNANKRTPSGSEKGGKGCLFLLIIVLLGAMGGFGYLLYYLSSEQFDGSSQENPSKESSSKGSSSGKSTSTSNRTDLKLNNNKNSETAVNTKKSGGNNSATNSDKMDKNNQQKTDSNSDGKDKPRFEFYTILPEMEVVIPEDELKAEERKTTHSDQDLSHVTNVSNYVLQAGSFKDYKDADRQKAGLALLGVVAKIESVEIARGDRRYRVQVRNFSSLDDVKKTKALLSDNGIDSILLKRKKRSR